jgi:hypothetical protein
MALSTAITTLKYCLTQGGSYAKLVDITNYPDLGSAPSKLDTTDLSQQKYKTNILGLQEAPDLTFEALYNEATFNTINGLTGTYWFNLEFGTNGADGIFEWSGQMSAFVAGGGVDEIRKMNVITSMATAITFEYSA